MTSERFLTVQAEIEHSPAPLWERWTVDEIDEDATRVLISRAGDARQLRDIAERVMTERTSPSSGPTRRLVGVLRSEAMRVELDPAAQEWSEESFGFAPTARLHEFLRGRSGKPGLPTDRPLREGDVFWVLVADWQGSPDPPSDLSMTELENHIAQLEQATPDVWDVTAAARQAAKRFHHEALRKTNEEDDKQEQAERG